MTSAVSVEQPGQDLTSYEASHIKRRRSTKVEVEARRSWLHRIVKEIQPATVRQVFYQASVHGIVDKSEAGYTKVQTDLVLMRRAGELPNDWLADNTRWQRKPRSFGGIEEALADTARLYRKALWTDADAPPSRGNFPWKPRVSRHPRRATLASATQRSARTGGPHDCR